MKKIKAGFKKEKVQKYLEKMIPNLRRVSVDFEEVEHGRFKSKIKVFVSKTMLIANKVDVTMGGSIQKAIDAILHQSNKVKPQRSAVKL